MTSSEYPLNNWLTEDGSAEMCLDLVENCRVGILVRTKGTHKILYANATLYRWLGYEPGDLAGLDVTAIIPNKVKKTTEREMALTDTTTNSPQMIVLRCADGSSRPMLVFPQSYDEDRVYLINIRLRDIMEAKYDQFVEGFGVENEIARLVVGLNVVARGAFAASPAFDFESEKLVRLTARERTVVQEIASGSRTSHIAKNLSISPHTVRKHLKNVYRKLGVSSQTDLVDFVRSEKAAGSG